MNKVYQLTAHNLKHNFRIEHRIFTSKKAAMQSLDRLINYLNFNHSLDSKETQIISEDSKRYHVVLEHQYAVHLETLEITKKVCEYI